jgi:hypothetical protein
MTIEDRRFAIIRQKVADWFVAEGLTVAQASSSDAAWLLHVNDSENRVIFAGQDPDRPNVVAIMGPVQLGEPHFLKIDALAPPDREAFLWDLRFELLRMGVEFQGVTHPLRQVTVSHRVHWEGLQKGQFLDAVALVKRGVLAVVWSVQRKLG